ncbi:GGDEF domain-containing protein [Simplicispira hankyongi]|uniref:diguanylate cyclase n=1 Tax=Simplicispira hankyongi TaxID=2315688 RepID=A0A398C9V0_9BURK|nr:GGDEF domain-containing protein [Simplicispira hankyongi]RID97120.1 GGDEF domain-containing protein [Simplicispira hankyongi]
MSESTPAFAVDQSPDRIWPLRGEFVEPALEQDFRASTLSRVLPQQRAGLVLWAALMVVFAVPDYLALGAVPNFWILAAYRGVFALLLLGAAEAFKRRPNLALQGYVLVGLALLGYSFFFLLYGLRPDIRAFNTGAIMVIQVMLFLFVPVRVAMAAPVALFGAIGATLSVWATTADASVKVGTAFLVALPAVLGYAAALRQQKTERLEFLLRRQLLDANRELKDEVVRRVALQGELERQAFTDLLTGLPNRRALAERFATESARAQRRSEPLSLAMFDLDHFKRVNDTHGHAGGDAVLRGVGEVCARSFRGADMAARVGGEEFAVLLPDVDLQRAGTVLQRFNDLLAATPAMVGDQAVAVTATAGVAQHQPGEDLNALMARADAAMYAGKQAGRNRVVLVPADAAPAPS